MTLPLLYDPAARAEADEAHDRYDAERPGLGERFERSLLAAEGLASNAPHAGSPLAHGRRRVLLDGFPYALVYRLDEERRALVVLAVAHFSRHPDSWRDRESE